ncbi:tetraacyldisaccharide 4'-kinase [Falsihalocynthiibacter sp. S25ZX9]|uniref:tetraacyldisaccharide 4'-kinase n=1 Tax=Falsihalocynthiibacter sp. S25ZX9 TaxID=3240870 RepID=UPI0035104D32
MKQPLFWYRPFENSWRDKLLAPLGKLYAAGTARRLSKTNGYRPKMPVICVGNINIGGTGKTPTAIALIQLLQGMGRKPALLSRGYGGKFEGPVLIDPNGHSSSEVGDEPMLLAAFAPCIVAKDRAAGARFAETLDIDVLILDDGFQNPSVAKDLSIVVVDAALGFGNGRVIPAGPLREPLHVGLIRADMVISVGSSAAQEQFTKAWGHAVGVPRLEGELTVLQMGMDFSGLRCLAFAGIGHPEKFFETLKSQEVELIKTVALADHQPLSEALMRRLEFDAATLGAQLITTEKDAVRLPSAFRQKVLTLPVRLEIKDATALVEALKSAGID